jgi:hypothetical protein
MRHLLSADGGAFSAERAVTEQPADEIMVRYGPDRARE